MKEIPPDYYLRLDEAERTHWYHRGMEELSIVLLAPILERSGLALLDAGCGAGGFLRLAQRLGPFERLYGVDVSAEAVELARERVPEAELVVGGLAELPWPDGSVDVVTLNDVLQHVDEAEIEPGLRELRRVLRPRGVLLVRTNGSLRGRRERSDWRLYNRATLAAELRRGGFRPERITYANTAVSLLRAARRRTPAAPTASTSGLPGSSGGVATAIGTHLLRAEARFLSRRRARLPYGHTLFAVATPE